MDWDGAKLDELVRLGLITPADRKEGTAPSDFVKRGVLTTFQVTKILEGKAQELVVGSYVLLDKLGAGGMGSVFKARHRKMRRIAAIKILSPELMKSAEGVQRFQREIEVIARLNHPNIVIAYDAGECTLGHFLIMEFVDGVDLHNWVAKKGKLGLEEAVGYFREAAAGLGYIHKQGLIHRDIKPANLLRTNQGSIKVTDLGLVRLPDMDEPEETDSDATAAPLTVGISGTFDYMAPEQAEDTRSVDHRADIYSLGCSFWFLLTGQHLYNEKSLVQKVKAHAIKPIPPLSQALTQVPMGLEAWWKKMVAKQAKERFSNLEEAIAQMAQVVPAFFAGSAPVLVSSAPASATQPVANEAPTVVGGPTTHPGMRGILLVEPSRVQQAMIARQLDELGFKTVHRVAGVGQAVEAFMDRQPGIVISSLHLPDGTGVELVGRIRAQAATSSDSGDCHFIVISSDDDWESTTRDQVGGIVHLAKPFTKAQLGDVLKRLADPTADGDSASTGTVVDGQLATAGPCGSWADARVLIVDDSGFSRKRMKAVFTGMGVSRITEAADAQEALEYLASRSFDFVTTDCQMPRMCGDELVAHVRAQKKWDEMGLIMVTGETDPELLNRVRLSGADEVLSKLTSEDGFREVLRRLRPTWGAEAPPAASTH